MEDDREEDGDLRVTDVSFGLAVKQVGRDIELLCGVLHVHKAWLNEECLRRIVAFGRRMGYTIPGAADAPAVGVGYASTGTQPTGDASGDPSEREDIGYGVTVTSEEADVRLTTDSGSIWLNEAAFKRLVRFARKVKGWKTL